MTYENPMATQPLLAEPRFPTIENWTFFPSAVVCHDTWFPFESEKLLPLFVYAWGIGGGCILEPVGEFLLESVGDRVLELVEGCISGPVGCRVLEPVGGCILEPVGGCVLEPVGGCVLEPVGGCVLELVGGCVLGLVGGCVLGPGGACILEPKSIMSVATFTCTLEATGGLPCCCMAPVA